MVSDAEDHSQPSSSSTSNPSPQPSVIPQLDSSLVLNASTQCPIKLNQTNYAYWFQQFHTLLIGYDLLGFVYNTHPCPPPTLPSASGPVPNPAHSLWVRQDQLLLNAILGSLSSSLVPFITTTRTSSEAWQSLYRTYNNPSRGRLMPISGLLDLLHKGSKSVRKYMQYVKILSDTLSLMNASLAPDCLTDKILVGLDEDYASLCSAIRAQETSISFDELHKKLIAFEAHLQHQNNRLMY